MLKLKINKVVIISFLIFAQLTSWGQNNTNSPYTRFGYGELADRSVGAGRAMGGVGYGLRNPKQINPMNPASYSSMDSLTFLFDFGVSGQVSWLSDGTNSERKLNGNVEYITMQFPISRRLAVSLGLLPFSHVGYQFGESQTENGLSWGEAFSGSGSLSEAYGGVSFDIWKKRLAVGANVGFLFGNLTHARTLTFPESSGSYGVVRSQEYEVRDLLLDFGVQYTHPLSKTERLTLGLVYSPGQQLSTTVYNQNQLLTSSSSTVSAELDTISNYRFDLPSSYGAGISYVKDNRLTLALDFLYQDWGKAHFEGEKGAFKNRFRIGGGVEFIPRHDNRNYFGRIRYRAGVHYGDSYLRVGRSAENNYQGHGYKEYGASVGFGLPLIDNRSLLNISFEYVKTRPELSTMVEQQYFRFAVSYAFNELWFFKRKVD